MVNAGIARAMGIVYTVVHAPLWWNGDLLNRTDIHLHTIEKYDI
jgi:hypothetical protein